MIFKHHELVTRVVFLAALIVLALNLLIWKP